MPITDPEVINELLSIEAMADLLKQRATGLRKKLQSPSQVAEAPRKGLDEKQVAEVLGRFRKGIIKRQNKKAAGGTAA